MTTYEKLVEFLRRIFPDADPHAEAIVFLCREIDELKQKNNRLTPSGTGAAKSDEEQVE